MEYLRRLHECHTKNITFKQAFFKLGMTEDNKPMKQLNDKEEFSTLANWALNKLPMFHSMDLRLKVNGTIYQTTWYKCGRQVRAGRVTRKDYQGAIGYDWPEEIGYDSLTVDVITASVMRAEIINMAKKNGNLLSREEIAEQENLQSDWNSGTREQTPQIRLVRTDRNCWDVVLTQEERNLISEFLDV